MFGTKKVRKPKYMNPWYEMSLNAIGNKIARDIKPDTTYQNIPFGRSLLDIHTDGDFVFITIKTVVNGEMIVEEIRDSLANLSYHLQAFKFENRWEKADVNVVFTPETMKQITVGISRLLHDSNVKDSWIFPYFNFFISVDVDNVKRYAGRKWISASAYLRSFDDEYVCGGGVSGSFLEDDEELKIDRWGRKEYVVRLDQSIHSALGISYRWKLFSDKEYAAIGTSPQFPVKVIEKVSSTRPDPSRRSKII